MPEGLQEIGKEAFQNCSIEELEIPRSVQMIEDHAFYGNKLKQLEIFIGYKDRIADIFGEIDEKIITWIN